MKFLCLLLLLTIQVGGQSAVLPVRVSVAPPREDRLNRELADAVRAELRKRRYVVLTSRRPDYDVGFIAAPLATENTKCSGFVAAMVIVDQDKPDERVLALYLGADAQSLARVLVERLEKEFPKDGR